jgi:hypothetical protein
VADGFRQVPVHVNVVGRPEDRRQKDREQENAIIHQENPAKGGLRCLVETVNRGRSSQLPGKMNTPAVRDAYGTRSLFRPAAGALASKVQVYCLN